MTPEEFTARVATYLRVRPDGGMDVSRMARLAARFATMTSTPASWARGTSLPHPLLQAQVVQFIEENS